jgi:hypothetical protein
MTQSAPFELKRTREWHYVEYVVGIACDEERVVLY